MADNSSLFDDVLQIKINDRSIFVQFLVIIFLCINMLLIVTFFKKECFHTRARYILFAVMMLSDSLMLIMSDILLILSFSRIAIPVWLCTIISIVMLLYSKVTPVTLTAMTLERYVAICMPLRHAELCSTRSTMYCILIIHGISSVVCIVIFSIFFASVSLNFYKQNRICSVGMFILHAWQGHVRTAMNQIYFLIMCVIIIFSYDKIMKVAKAASGENKELTKKGLRTVLLHAFQLLLCLARLWCPFIETAVFQNDVNLYANLRYFNYILFSLAPRCLSPLIFGLRDETFCLAIKNYVCFCFIKRNIT